MCPPKSLGGCWHRPALDMVSAKIILEREISDEQVDGLEERLVFNKKREGPLNYQHFFEATREESEYSDVLRLFMDVNCCIDGVYTNALY